MKKFLILVTDNQLSNTSFNAFNFCQRSILLKNKIVAIFFMHNGVLNAQNLELPSDESTLYDKWIEFADSNNIDLICCNSAAQRRGVVDLGTFKFGGLTELIALLNTNVTMIKF